MSEDDIYEFRAYCDICKEGSQWERSEQTAKTWRTEHFEKVHLDNPMKKTNCRIKRRSVNSESDQ
jgi:hypothetical protein